MLHGMPQNNQDNIKDSQIQNKSSIKNQLLLKSIYIKNVIEKQIYFCNKKSIDFKHFRGFVVSSATGSRPINVCGASSGATGSRWLYQVNLAIQGQDSLM